MQTNIEPRQPFSSIPRAVAGFAALIIVGVIIFLKTKSLWFDSIGSDNKALFWASAVQAASSLVLLIVAAWAAIVAYRQFLEYKRISRVESTTDLLREWSKPKIMKILDFLDFEEGPDGNRRFARLLYRFVYSNEGKPGDLEKVREWRLDIQKRRRRVHNAIEEIALMASRTLNLLTNGVIEPDILFGQVDFYIVAAYYTLEDILAVRQFEGDYLYSDFTALAREAQKAYRRRPYREVIDDYLEANFYDLPYGEAEFEEYTQRVLIRERAVRRIHGEENSALQ